MGLVESEKTMRKIKPSLIVATISWVSLLILTWLIILNLLPLDWIRAATWLLFLVVGIGAAVIASDRKKSD